MDTYTLLLGMWISPIALEKTVVICRVKVSIANLLLHTSCRYHCICMPVIIHKNAHNSPAGISKHKRGQMKNKSWYSQTPKYQQEWKQTTTATHSNMGESQKHNQECSVNNITESDGSEEEGKGDKIIEGYMGGECRDACHIASLYSQSTFHVYSILNENKYTNQKRTF